MGRISGDDGFASQKVIRRPRIKLSIFGRKEEKGINTSVGDRRSAPHSPPKLTQVLPGSGETIALLLGACFCFLSLLFCFFDMGNFRLHVKLLGAISNTTQVTPASSKITNTTVGAHKAPGLLALGVQGRSEAGHGSVTNVPRTGALTQRGRVIQMICTKDRYKIISSYKSNLRTVEVAGYPTEQ